MDMSGERLIPAPKEKVWAALHDPETLKACLPGFDTFEKLSDSEMKATATVRLGPIAALFAGKALLSDLDPPNGYTISGESQGGEAGFANGNAKIALLDEGDGTKLVCKINSQLGGKIAELDTNLVNSAAHQYAEAFFSRLSAIVTPAQAAKEPISEGIYHLTHEDHDHDPSNPHYFGLPLGVILATLVAIVAVGITLAKFIH
jgi:carbon monoxide dehydrogenase subunit G